MYHNWCTCPGAKVITILVIVIKFIMMVIGAHAQVVQEYERAVIFRLGRLRKGGAKVGTTFNKYQKYPNLNPKGQKSAKKFRKDQH